MERIIGVLIVAIVLLAGGGLAFAGAFDPHAAKSTGEAAQYIEDWEETGLLVLIVGALTAAIARLVQ